MASVADRNLLFGILALQMDIITREELIPGRQRAAAKPRVVSSLGSLPDQLALSARQVLANCDLAD